MGSYNQQQPGMSGGGGMTMNKPGQFGAPQGGTSSYGGSPWAAPGSSPQGPTMQQPIGQPGYTLGGGLSPVGSPPMAGAGGQPTPGAPGAPMGNPMGGQNIVTWGDYDRFKQGGAYGGTGAFVPGLDFSPEAIAAKQAQTVARQQGFADQRAALNARNAQIRGQTAPPGLSQGGDPLTLHGDTRNALTGAWVQGHPYLGGGLLGNQGPRLPLPRRTNGY